MRLIIAAFIALTILVLIDDQFNGGRYVMAARQLISKVVGKNL